MIRKLCISLLAATVVVVAHAQDLIGPQSVEEALAALARQTGLQFIYGSDVVRGRQSKGAPAGLSAKDTLNRMLEGTGLAYEFLNERTVTIVVSAGRDKARRSASAAGSGLFQASGDSTLQLAQAQGAEAGQTAATQGPEETNNAAALELEEVVVTGTHIRGTTPVGSSLKVYTREDLDRSGASTVDQFARQMLENFSSADTIAIANANSIRGAFGQESGQNSFGGATFNLRGVSPKATLTLINGQRLAAAGFDGSMVDISQIPMSAVERIEVLADGASAIYGADAVSGVVNIIMRKNFEGAETQVRYAEATEGGAVDLTASQLLGTSWSGGNVLLNYEYDDQDGLDASERDYIGPRGGPYTLIPENRRHSVYLSGRQEIGAGFTLGLDAIYSDRDGLQQNTADAVFGPFFSFTQTKNLQEVKQSGGTLSLEHALSTDWELSIAANYSRNKQFNDGFAVFNSSFGSGTQALDTTTRSDVVGGNVLANGRLFDLPGGAVKAAVGVSYRQEEFENVTTQSGVVDPTLSVPSDDRNVTSVYGELAIPLIGEPNARSGMRRLELSAALRFDDYSDFGSSVNPKFGLTWEPVAGLVFRGSYGTSFRAPLLSELNSSNQITTSGAFGPGGFTSVLFVNGGNAQLDPEESKSLTVGFDVKPIALPNLSLGITYFSLDFEDRITNPPVVNGNFFDPLLAPYRQDSPPLSLVGEYFAGDHGFFLGDFAGLGQAGVTAILDFRNTNIAKTEESGLDFTAGYRLASPAGDFDFSLNIARLFDNDFFTLDGVAPISLVNVFGHPVKWRGRSGIGFSRSGFGGILSINYTNSYSNTLVTPVEKIDSWTTADLNLRYAVGDGAASLLQGVTVALNVLNVTDEEPPFATIPQLGFVVNPIPYDSTNASPVGRLISLSVAKRW